MVIDMSRNRYCVSECTHRLAKENLVTRRIPLLLQIYEVLVPV